MFSIETFDVTRGTLEVNINNSRTVMTVLSSEGKTPKFSNDPEKTITARKTSKFSNDPEKPLQPEKSQNFRISQNLKKSFEKISVPFQNERIVFHFDLKCPRVRV